MTALLPVIWKNDPTLLTTVNNGNKMSCKSILIGLFLILNQSRYMLILRWCLISVKIQQSSAIKKLIIVGSGNLQRQMAVLSSSAADEVADRIVQPTDPESGIHSTSKHIHPDALHQQYDVPCEIQHLQST